ncbi:EpsI family protein [Hyphococcus flavus]|uniref:EpsI family protein n=1 Tax=Hyphococcus flavus TaxID=1866326 RepID=A0AAE9ZB93_9PROT|nr:exosortase A [Hyphococcus flavus]WDI31369.1 EpsI family protein [Hyphococcus flavus]
MTAFVSEISTARRSAWALPVFTYGVYVTALIVLLYPTASSMAATWLGSSSYHHGVLVAPIAVWMILSGPRITPSTSLIGVIGVVFASMIWIAGNAAGVALIEQIALVSLLIAGAAVNFGREAVKYWLAPLLFLFFMVPFGAAIVPPLQYATANTTVLMLGAVGMPVSLDGILIRTPAGLFEIAEACAGLNFLLAALMVSAVYAISFFRSNRTRLAFVLTAAAVALAANFLRVFLLIMIATLSGMKIAVGPDHLAIGFVFYACVFGVLIWIGERMRLSERKSPDRSPSMMYSPWRKLTAISALLPIATVSLYAGEVVNADVKRSAPQSLSPLNAPGWRILAGPENWRPSTTADRSSVATYVNRDQTVYAALSYFTHDRRSAEIANYHNRAWDNKDWRKIGVSEEMIYLFGDARMTLVDLIAGPEGRRLAAVSIYWRGDKVYKDAGSFKVAQMVDKLRGINPPGGQIIIAAAYRSDPAEALASLRPFTHEVEDFSAWRLRNKND